MKKVVMVFAVLFLVAFFTGCQTDSYIDPNKDEYGNLVYTTNTDRTIYLSSLPYAIPYNENEVVFEDVDFYQLITSDGSYTLFAVATIDVSPLNSELDSFWENDFDSYAFVDTGKADSSSDSSNEYEPERLHELGKICYTDKAYVVFISSPFDSVWESFAGKEISITVSISQNDPSAFKQVAYYSVTVPATMESPESIEEPLYGNIVEWLNSDAEFYASLY